METNWQDFIFFVHERKQFYKDRIFSQILKIIVFQLQDQHTHTLTLKVLKFACNPRVAKFPNQKRGLMATLGSKDNCSRYAMSSSS